MRISTRRAMPVLAAALLLIIGPAVAGSALATGGHISFGVASLVPASGTHANLVSSPTTSFGIVTLPTDGTPYTLTVAFTDDNPTPALSATINWGDATTSAGIIAGTAPAYSVSGTHSWADEGTDVVTVTITDTSTTPSTMGSDTLTYRVSEGDLHVAANPLSFVEGQSTGGTVLTFTDGTGTEIDNPYSANIDWGDGTITLAAISAVAGVYSVLAPIGHSYVDEGAFTATVTVNEFQVPQTPLFISHLPVTVTEGDVLVPEPLPSASVPEGQPFPVGGPVGTFSDVGYLGNVPSDFTATISWGDGSPVEAGVVGLGAPGVFTVSPETGHIYPDEGSYPVSVTLTEDSPGTATATDSYPVAVIEEDVLVGALSLSSATEGVAITSATTVATFTDPGYPANGPSDFTATIDWGDGSPIAVGVISEPSPGLCLVAPALGHTYADEGTYSVSVTMADDAPGFAIGTTVPGTITVTEGDTLTGSLSVTHLPHVFSGAVASFTDTGYPANVASDFTALIDWGDTTTSAGTVTKTGPGAFSVSGTHSYLPGVSSETISVTLSDDAPGTATATASGTVAVVDPPLISKAFGVSSDMLGGSTSLAFTVTNPNPAGLAGVGFVDSLPAGLVVATPNGLSGSCGGGTITASAGSGSVSLAGASLGAASSCSFGVNVTGTSAGTKVNNVSASATVPGSGPSATATLTVLAPDLTITKHHVGNLVRFRVGAYTMVVTNAGPSRTAGPIRVTDSLPFGLTGVAGAGSGWICTLTTSKTTLTCIRSDSLAAGASYPPITFSVEPLNLFFGPTFVVNVAQVSGGGEVYTVNDTASDPTTIDPY